MSEKYKPSPENIEPPEDPALISFKEQIIQAKHFKHARGVPSTKERSAHDLMSIQGLRGDQARVVLPVAGKQEIMVEDKKIEDLLKKGEILLKRVGKPKSPYKVGQVIQLTPDRLKPIDVIIFEIQKSQGKATNLLLKLFLTKE